MPTPRSLPTIRTYGDLLPYLKRWGQAINPLLKRVDTPAAPYRFRVTNQRGGNLLEWDAVDNVDGYEILKSTSGDFDEGTSFETIALRSDQHTSYFDGLSGSGAAVTVQRYYKLRATAGTTQNPHVIKGLLTGIVTATTIDPADTATAGGTTEDTTTGDDQSGRGDIPILY